MDEIRIPLHFREGMYHLNELPTESDDFLLLRWSLVRLYPTQFLEKVMWSGCTTLKNNSFWII